MAKKRTRRSGKPTPKTPSPDTPLRPRSGFGGGAWRMFPFRGRFLSPAAKFVLARMPEAPATFTSATIALACAEADATLDLDVPCNPAEIIDLLTSRGLVTWTDAGFVKRRRAKRPKA